MKKIILFAFLLMINTMAATCELTWPIDIFFKDSTIWRDKYAFASGSVYVTEDGYNCEKKEFEKAFLDSNVFLYRNPLKKTLFIYSNDIDTYNEGDVFRDEFLHWQKCGMLKMSYEEAPPQSNKSIAINNAKLVVENSVVHVPQILQGEKYFIFDMNGRILQKGFAEKMIRIEHSPSILKLGDEIPLFLK